MAMTNEHIETVINKFHNTLVTQKQMQKIMGKQTTISMRFVTKDLELIEIALKQYLEEKKNGKKS